MSPHLDMRVLVAQMHIQHHASHYATAHLNHTALTATIHVSVFLGRVLMLTLCMLQAGSQGRLIVDSVVNINLHYTCILWEWWHHFLDCLDNAIVPALRREYLDTMSEERGMRDLFKCKWNYYNCLTAEKPLCTQTGTSCPSILCGHKSEPMLVALPAANNMIDAVLHLLLTTLLNALMPPAVLSLVHAVLLLLSCTLLALPPRASDGLIPTVIQLLHTLTLSTTISKNRVAVRPGPLS
ncbi:hypothetical protein K439DRAFT_1614222 [Ramaria rubella]|nr:hypothetical protein K439DRAFT_1614222 [Ramaria rubella]